MSHTIRHMQEQSLHDKVIAYLERCWRGLVNVSINPGSKKNRWVGNQQNQNYPDLIGWIREGNTDRPLWIVEVETVSSINEIEAQKQWANYATLGVPFYLVVPTGYVPIAKRITERLEITVNEFYEYYYDLQNDTLRVVSAM